VRRPCGVRVPGAATPCTPSQATAICHVSLALGPLSSSFLRRVAFPSREDRPPWRRPMGDSDGTRSGGALGRKPAEHRQREALMTGRSATCRAVPRVGRSRRLVPHTARGS
jgi:hypothetical protein